MLFAMFSTAEYNAKNNAKLCKNMLSNSKFIADQCKVMLSDQRRQKACKMGKRH